MTNRFYSALSYATKAHDGQYDREGKPYILHPLFLSSKMQEEDWKIVALFHDIIADTKYTLDDIKSWGFGDLVEPIDCITKRKGEENYTEYLERVCSNPISLRVKIADMEHNSDISRLKEVTEKDLKMIEKYKKHLPKLKEIFQDQNEVEVNFYWFQENLSEYMKKYKGKFMLIRKCKMEGVFDTFHDAYKQGVEKFGESINGESDKFSVQEVTTKAIRIY